MPGELENIESGSETSASEIVSMSVTYSWGSCPASASVALPGENADFSAMDDVVLSLGALSFHGVITSNPVRTEKGKYTELQIADNRIRLQWDVVFGMWNMQQVIEDDVLTPGVDRMRRFWHILPENWETQTKTYTDAPMSAFDIIDSACSAAVVEFHWELHGHADMADTPAYNIDANNGKKLGNVLQEVSEQCGVVFTLVGEDQLVWARKGEGAVPTPPAGTNGGGRQGYAVSHNDTRVTIVGPRNVYQDLQIELEADWNPYYESFLAEAAWIKEVRDNFNDPDTSAPYAADEEGQAKLIARARSITLREYVGNVTEEPDLRKWGEISRMEMPVWIYLREIVFKSYRIPRTYTLNDIPLDSLEIFEGLLARVDYNSTTGAISYKSPREYYPEGKAFVLVKGQQLDLIDARNEKIITQKLLDDGRSLWTSNDKFSIDRENKCIIFEQQQFIPGEGSEALYLFPNRGAAGVVAGDLIYNVCVPNAAATFAPAQVRVSLCFEAEKYSSTHGSGPRRGTVFLQALNFHLLVEGGVVTEQVKYADGKETEELASTYAASMILQQEIYLEGGYKRIGGCGTALNGSVDRVTATLDFGGGISEQIEYTKERASATFVNERMMDRLAKMRDLFPGEKANRTEIWGLRQIAAQLAKAREESDAFIGPTIPDIMQRPLGSQHPAVQIVHAGQAEADAGGSDCPSLAGVPLFKKSGGLLDKASGTVFAGVTISAGNDAKSDVVHAATSGVVPVRVKGPFKSGDSVGVNMGGDVDAFCTVGGSRNVGVVNTKYAGTDIVTVPVRLGSGARSAGALPVVRRQPFEPYESGFYQSGFPKYFLARGTICEGDENNTAVTIPTGAGATGSLDDMFVLNNTDAQMCWFKCVFEADGTITFLERQTGNSWPGFPNSFATGGGGAGSNTWYHPVARMRVPHTTKSSVNSLDGQPFPDSGEEFFVGDGTVEPFYTVVQLTNTHLVGQQQCMDTGSGTVMGWKLVPGPGAVAGAES